MKKIIKLMLIMVLVFSIFIIPEVSAEMIELRYTFWGSTFEKEATENAIEAFNEAHPNINVKSTHIPDNYAEKISSMLAAGDPPDVAMVDEGYALRWASQGQIVDLTTFLENDSDIGMESYIPNVWFLLNDGEETMNIGTTPGLETMILFYNKDIFDNQDIDYPSAKPGDLKWNEFVDLAKKLTVDQNGNHPDDPDFNPDNIKTYGVSFSTWDWPVLPFLWSNGGGLVNEEGTKSIINQPESVEVLEKMQSLMYKHHVAPTPVQMSTLPGFNILMQSGKVAMAIDGQWALLDLSQGRFDLGVAPLPVFNEPVALLGGAPVVIFEDSENPEAAWKLYKWLLDPESALPLYENGLWMPGQKKWYTDSEYVDRWVENDAHPAEYREGVLDYALNYSRRSPTFYMKNYPQIRDNFNSILENFWLNKESAQDAADNLAEELDEILEGRWDQ